MVGILRSPILPRIRPRNRPNLVSQILKTFATELQSPSARTIKKFGISRRKPICRAWFRILLHSQRTNSYLARNSRAIPIQHVWGVKRGLEVKQKEHESHDANCASRPIHRSILLCIALILSAGCNSGLLDYGSAVFPGYFCVRYPVLACRKLLQTPLNHSLKFLRR